MIDCINFHGALFEFPLCFPSSATLTDNQLKINTNPVEVYKQWVNSIESQTGRPSGHAYNVTVEEALKHAPVRENITNSIHSLKVSTEKFLKVILDSADKLPYVIRYVDKVVIVVVGVVVVIIVVVVAVPVAEVRQLHLHIADM